MRARVTTKELKARFQNVFLVDSQKYEIFRLVEPDYYTAGIYGLNAEYWDLGGVLFVDGYRPFYTERASDRKELVDFLEKSNDELEAIDDYQAKKIRSITLSLNLYKLVQK